ncbi:hypothetical protein BU24DRAFT_395363 [Aaosphaeria arxii CBS 175.79]|uniref:Ubiquitin interaction motif protein n=1 Tax=Aaosphaeria arxii CBS 175.79 TaxID=1450172 RepID=A0A6A5XHX9_9PLEO|nr:uncharacterized protein BU24DRAFT_395363 [Aaosphaeria arxii CBS 175.79]KAF2012457.1 hypothetical protein BU24DRAFT_395363 [Aaosphaeria arxii CBS 175.79]
MVVSEADVDTFLAFIGDGVSREVAATVLRQQGSVEAAVNKFYDNLDNPAGLIQPENNNYDPNAFSADRYGETEPGGLPSFRIDYPPGTDNFNGSHSVAPSRPPSRTSQHAATPGTGDVPIQSIENGQELGVINNANYSKPMFGPANKDQVYDSNSWAMVPVSKSTEYIPDAVPVQRKREEEGPAIIKPTPNWDYLPSLISIIHTIPLFRNALLAPEISLRSYHAGEDWWKGSSTASKATVVFDSEDESPHDLDLIHEMQRLMAFLDRTDRAYGSIGALQQLDAWKKARDDMTERPNDELLTFLLKWGDAYHNLTSKPLDGVFRSVISAEGQEQSSALLDANIIHHEPGTKMSLYDVLDENLFESVAGAGTAFIKSASDVLVFRLESSDAKGKLDCKIPATLYADRYLEENKEAIAAMVHERKQCDARIKEIDEEAAKIKYHTTKKIRPGEKMETLKLLKSSMAAFQQKSDDLIHDPKNATILTQLQSLYDSIERKLNALEEQKKQARKSLDDMSSRFRAPFVDGDEESPAKTDGDGTEQDTEMSMKHPYKLCGVSTHSNVVYLLHPNAKTNDRDTEWWRVEYSTPGSDLAYVLRERLSLSSVLEKASEENRSALLVYASEAALSPDPIPLSDALDRFVKADNLSFQEELQTDLEFEPWDPTSSWAEEPDAKPYQDHNSDPDAFENISAERFYQQQSRAQSAGPSISANEKPTSGIEEMCEVNGGFSAWAGASNASSETIAGDSMDLVESQGQAPAVQGATEHGPVEVRDVEMGDAEDSAKRAEARPEAKVQHIEFAGGAEGVAGERKGG